MRPAKCRAYLAVSSEGTVNGRCPKFLRVYDVCAQVVSELKTARKENAALNEKAAATHVRFHASLPSLVQCYAERQLLKGNILVREHRGSQKRFERLQKVRSVEDSLKASKEQQEASKRCSTPRASRPT